MKISCIVIDDEFIARRALADYVNKVELLELKGVFKNAMQAGEYLEENEVDLLFLDIEMPQVSGLQFLRKLDRPIYVIFTTAYSKFALDSFEFNVIDYLLKPISFDRFLQAVNKCIPIFDKSSTSEETAFLFLKEGTQLKKVIIADICYVEAMQNYVRIHTEKGSMMVLMTLKELINQLPTTNFLQSHRSFLVNRDKINRIEEHTIYINSNALPISKRLRAEFLKRVKKNT